MAIASNQEVEMLQEMIHLTERGETNYYTNIDRTITCYPDHDTLIALGEFVLKLVERLGGSDADGYCG